MPFDPKRDLYSKAQGKDGQDININELDENGESLTKKQHDQEKQENRLKDENDKLDSEVAGKLAFVKKLLHSELFDDAKKYLDEAEQAECNRVGSKGYCDNPEVYWYKVLLKYEARDEEDLISKMPDLEHDNVFKLGVECCKTEEQKQHYTTVLEKIEQAKAAESEQENLNNKKQSDEKAAKHKAELTAEEEARQKRLKRIFRLIDAGEFDEAKERLDKIEQEEEDRTGDCEIPQVYHYKMLLDYKARTDEELIACLIKNKEDISQNKNFRLANGYAIDSEDDDELNSLLDIKKQANEAIAKEKEAERAREEEKRKIENTVKQADAAFAGKDYQKAAELYNQAAALGADVQQKAKLSAQKAEEEKHRRELEEVVKQADAAFASKDYQKAVDLYNKATTLGATGIKTKADQAAKMLKEEQDRKKAVADAVKQADNAFTKLDYQKALELYNQAIALGGGDEVKQKAQQAAKEVENEKQRKIRIEEERKRDMEGLVKRADAAFANNEYQNAVDLYKKAAAFGADVKTKADQAAQKLKEEQDRKQKLADTVKQADAAFAGKDYQKALDLYNQAITLGGGDDIKQKAQQAAQKVEEERQNKIADFIKQADAAFACNDYQGALDLYNQAIGLGGGDSDVKKKAKQAKQKVEEEKNNLKTIETVKQGDAAFANGDYQKALDLYNQAVKLGNTSAQNKAAQAAQKVEEERQNKIADLIRQAEAAFAGEDYTTAVELYDSAIQLGSADVQDKRDEALDKMWEEGKKRADEILNITGAFKQVDKDIVNFGCYPQSVKESNVKIVGNYTIDKERDYWLGSDNCLYYEKNYNTYYKVEPIRWKVLSRGLPLVGKYCVISEKVLDACRFDEYHNDYEKSEIRSWLNTDFYNKAFTDEQKSRIIKTTVDNSASSTGVKINQYACKNTQDKVFLLSYAEAEKLMDAKQIVSTNYKYSTAYAANRVTNNSNSYKYSWWLRSPDNNQGNRAMLYDEYRISSIELSYRFSNTNVIDNRIGVLPVIKFKP